MATNTEFHRNKLRHVYWIGGGSGGGKTTIARRLADAYGFRLYSTDEVMSDHAQRLTPDEAPFLAQFAAMDMDQRWATRTPEVMLETFHWFQGEGFRLIVEDILDLPNDPPVIVEGFRLLPDLVMPSLASTKQAVWLIPTPAFRRKAFLTRGTTWDIARKTSDPERALENLLERDRLFTDRLRTDVQRLQLQLLEIDTDMTEEEVADRVTNLLGI